jgi:agmatine deiminase
MVRFIDEDTVLINDYSKESISYQRNFRMALHNAGLDWIELPYNPYPNSNGDSACGVYINFLQMQQAIILPVFNSHFDDRAFKVISEVFKGQVIRTVNSTALAEQGGILNCISWNIAVS